MIITVTMNPALDKFAKLKTFHYGGLNRLQEIRSHAGGKGINVSRSIARLGGRSLAIGLIGGSVGLEIIQELDQLGISNDMVRVQGNTRTNLKLIDQDHNLSEFNEDGPKIDEVALLELEMKLMRLAQAQDVVVLSGSVPSNVPVTIYQSLCEKLKEKQVSVVLDADGDLFRYGIEAKPHVIKPNREELCRYLGAEEQTVKKEELIEACQRLVDDGIALVILSLGAQGAVFVSRDARMDADALSVPIVSAVGAGDAMCAAAALALQRQYPMEELVKLSMAAAASALMCEESACGDRETVEALKKQVQVHKKKP